MCIWGEHIFLNYFDNVLPKKRQSVSTLLAYPFLQHSCQFSWLSTFYAMLCVQIEMYLALQIQYSWAVSEINGFHSWWNKLHGRSFSDPGITKNHTKINLFSLSVILCKNGDFSAKRLILGSTFLRRITTRGRPWTKSTNFELRSPILRRITENAQDQRFRQNHMKSPQK